MVYPDGVGITGKQLEQDFGIVQQYRSRYDKQYSDFISPSSDKPRRYLDSDIKVYSIVLEQLKKGNKRPTIMGILVKAVENMEITFYGDDLEKYRPDPGNGKAPSPAKRTKPDRVPKASEMRLTARELIEIGEMRARLTFQEEIIGDLESKQEQNSEEIESLNFQVSMLAAKVKELSEKRRFF